MHSYRGSTIYKRYLFGTELSNEEVLLEKAIKYLNSLSKRKKLSLLIKGIFISSRPYKKILIRMKLDKPKNIKEYLYRFLLIAACCFTYDPL